MDALRKVLWALSRMLSRVTHRQDIASCFSKSWTSSVPRKCTALQPTLPHCSANTWRFLQLLGHTLFLECALSAPFLQATHIASKFLDELWTALYAIKTTKHEHQIISVAFCNSAWVLGKAPTHYNSLWCPLLKMKIISDRENSQAANWLSLKCFVPKVVSTT